MGVVATSPSVRLGLVPSRTEARLNFFPLVDIDGVCCVYSVKEPDSFFGSAVSLGMPGGAGYEVVVVRPPVAISAFCDDVPDEAVYS